MSVIKRICSNCVFNQTINYKGPLNDNLIFCSKFGCPIDINDVYDSDCWQGEMKKYEIITELNLKNIIAESREVAQALNEFADNLERIEKKFADPNESEEKASECEKVR